MNRLSRILACSLLLLNILITQTYARNEEKVLRLPVLKSPIKHEQSEENHSGGYIPSPFTLVGSAHPQVFSLRAGTNENLPSSYDLREINPVPLTEIKQQPYDNCWAYAAIASLESNLLHSDKVTRNELPDLSEEYLQFIGNYRPGDNTTFNNLKGGNREMATALLARDDALVEETAFDKTNYPFQAGVNRTTMPFFKPKAEFSVQDVVWLSDFDPYDSDYTKADRDAQIKRQIMKYGAVMSAYYSYGGKLNNQFYNAATASYYYNGSSQPDHAICIIGWDDTFSVENFNSAYRPKKNGAWIVRNTWGTGYGKNGYFYISYEDAWIGTSSASFIGAIEPYYNSYTYSDFGMGAAIQLESGAQLSSVFESSENEENLIAISTYITQISGYEGVTCSFFARQRGIEDKTPYALAGDLEPLSVKRYGDGEYSTKISIYDSGYFTFTLESPLPLQGKPFEIVMKLESAYPPETEDGQIYVMPVCIPVEYNYPGFSDNALAKQEECYIYTALSSFDEGTLLAEPRWLDFMGTECVDNLVFPCLKASGALLPSEPLQASLCLYAHTESAKPKNEVKVFTNTVDKSWSGIYLTGQYGKEGRILRYSSGQTVTPTDDSQSWTNFYFPELSDKCKSAKAFLWNTLPSMTPLTQPLTILPRI